MIHVLTIHHHSTRWIDIQVRAIREHVTGEVTLHANLEGVEARWNAHFDEVHECIGTHAGKLNAMAGSIARASDPDDVLVFLDGDAFPVADPRPAIEAGLERHALIAVRRDENLGDQQPHPSFAAVRAATWLSLPGDWSAGHTWSNALGQRVTDVGGNLAVTLRDRGRSWQPILRSWSIDEHPVYFGVYGGIVYHHGAGFRRPACRVDKARTASLPWGLRGAVWRTRRRLIARRSRQLFVAIRDGDPATLASLRGDLASPPRPVPPPGGVAPRS